VEEASSAARRSVLGAHSSRGDTYWAEFVGTMSSNSSGCPISSPDGGASAGAVLYGIIMTLLGALTLALSMALQRYGLAHKQRLIPICFGRGPKLHREVVWFFGLILYGVANAFKVLAAPCAPWSILSSVWTCLLVFNIIIAKVVLHEKPTWPKVASALVILLGAIVVVLGSPIDARDIQWSAEEFTAGLAEPAALVWTILLFGSVLASIPIIVCFDRRYERPRLESDMSASAVDTGDAVVETKPRASATMERMMLLVFAASLGLDEGIADLLLPKGWQAMLTVCNDPANTHLSCGHPMIWIAMALWILSAFSSTFFWMRKVYARYEVTLALPLECVRQPSPALHLAIPSILPPSTGAHSACCTHSLTQAPTDRDISFRRRCAKLCKRLYRFAIFHGIQAHAGLAACTRDRRLCHNSRWHCTRADTTQRPRRESGCMMRELDCGTAMCDSLPRGGVQYPPLSAL
jgi:hypothetical protein